MSKQQKKVCIAAGIVAYLFVGLWLGNLSYKIGTKPDEYSYGMRLVFFPATTLFREGISEKQKTDMPMAAPIANSLCNNQRPVSYYNVAITAAESTGSLSKAAYIAGVSVFWFFKFAANALFLQGAILYAVVALIINFILAMGIIVIYVFFLFLQSAWYFIMV